MPREEYDYDESTPRVPYREVQHDEDDPDFWFVPVFGVGHAKLESYPREVSQTEKRRWKREDAERDARRIPIGFSAVPLPAPEPAKPKPKRRPTRAQTKTRRGRK